MINLYKFAKIWTKVAEFNALNDHIYCFDANCFCDVGEALYWSQTVLKNRTFLLKLIEDARKQNENIKKMREYLKEICLFLVRQDVLRKFCDEATVLAGIELYNTSKRFFKKGKKKNDSSFTSFEVKLKRYLLDLLNVVRTIKNVNDTD